MRNISASTQQLPLFSDAGEIVITDYIAHTINLRDELKQEIPSTTYLTHAIHNVYPAKFIPQVPRFVIKTFNLKNAVILDPFAGSGTTAVESVVTRNSNISNDINPLTTFLVDVKTLKICPKDYLIYTNRLNQLVQSIFQSESTFLPKWQNINYWYPQQILEVLAKMWGGIHSIEENEHELKMLLKAAALHISRKYSYGEDKSPKLFRSKHKTLKMKELLNKFNRFGEQLLQNELLQRTKEYLEYCIQLNSEYALEYRKLNQIEKNKQGIFILTLSKSIDELSQCIPDSSVDCIVTSPPYIYAQEYFRSTKIDLYWLDMVNDRYVSELTKKEIGQKSYAFHPENGISKIDAYKDSFHTVQELSYSFKTKENVSRFAAYFGDMLYFIQLSARLLIKGGIIAIFIGEPKVFGHHVKARDIFVEMMAQNGFKLKYTLFDTIKGRHLSKNRLNENPEGISGEWLIIGEKL